MIDIINNGSTPESAEIIVERYEDQIRKRIAEKDIHGAAMNVYSIITLWCLQTPGLYCGNIEDYPHCFYWEI